MNKDAERHRKVGMSNSNRKSGPIIIERKDTPDTTPPTVNKIAITSDPGSDLIYAPDDEIEATVTFSEAVLVTGTPQLTLKVGGGDRTADYQGGTGTAALVFAYEVADGDEDTDGVNIEAGRIALNGGSIKDEADNDAVLDHEAVAPQAVHEVDGVRPAFLSASVDGSSLTLTYGETLDGGSRPASGDYTVEVDGAGRNVTGIFMSDTVVTLTLASVVAHDETVTVSYSPGANPIRDAAGNGAIGLSNEPVANETPETRAGPIWWLKPDEERSGGISPVGSHLQRDLPGILEHHRHDRRPSLRSAFHDPDRRGSQRRRDLPERGRHGQRRGREYGGSWWNEHPQVRDQRRHAECSRRH